MKHRTLTFLLPLLMSGAVSSINADVHEYVDLGLPSGTLWATCNIGASSPEEYGDCFAWGETETKTSFSLENYKWNDSTTGKYTTHTWHKLELSDDAAYVNWGELWRIGDSFGELFDARYTTIVENKNGVQIISTLNGNSIFLPEAGYWCSTADDIYGDSYWVTTPFDVYSSLNDWDNYRYEGMHIRPMCSWKAARVKEIILDVTSLALITRDTHQFSVTISPEDVEIKSVLWSSSNESVAIVDANGLVTAVGEGTCNIICTAQDGSRKSTSCKVEVCPYHDLSGTIDGYASVDLGLPSGTLWATQNVGASSPEDYGDYFAWGEVESKESYTRDNYKYFGEMDYTRYWNFFATWHDEHGELQGKWNYDTLSLYDSDDAAYMNWGSSKWYTPNQAQLAELINSAYTSIEWTIQNKVYGYKVTSKLNGNSIFLPAAGIFSDSSISEKGTYGYYWSKDLNMPLDSNWDNDICEPFILKLGTDDISVFIGGAPWRITGLSVRPVHSVLRVSNISLSHTNIIINKLGTAELTAIVSPSDAEYKELSWSSSNTDVATVSPTGLVTAVADGTCTITCATMDGSCVKATCTVTVTEPSTMYDLTVDESEHGTVTFTVGGDAITQAKKDDVVTVSVTPDAGYSTKDVTARAYTSWAAAARALNRATAPTLLDKIAVTPGTTSNTWTFTMPETNVCVVASYTKDLQDTWIQTIADQTYTGNAIVPTIEVKDGETTLISGTDYTVTYSDNVNAGTATVTITAMEGSDYSGTAMGTFTIAKADITMTTAPAAVEGLTYSGEAQTLVTAGVASFGTVLYSLDGETYIEALPQAAEAGTYTVSYMVEGDDNHNAFSAQTLSVTIATNKTVLNTAINEAETYYNSISESNPDAAAALQDAINTAKTVLSDANATQQEIETARRMLSEALETAMDNVLQRIAITIPAKSYVARIDADKRQIETAMAGVSLHSVKSVTDSEVELTAALTVVAAEMPYLIYNDNDEEKTINLVASSSEPTTEEYDSEHFKGTLVDKTFTDEDMQAADHYVLTKNYFVWVKNAGTLAAGKCWIELIASSEAHVRELVIVAEGNTTGINTVTTISDVYWYDLNGRRLAGKPKAKGVYMMNGKKVVVK